MKSVAMVLFPDFLLLDMAGPLEVFSIANRYLEAEHHYQLTTLGAVPGAIRASNGVTVQPDRPIAADDGGWDLLLVPGGPGAYNEICPPLNLWLQTLASRARHYGSICTGSFILGHAGLLDGYRVTTHWHYTERMARAFPRTRVETDQIYVRDRQLITSGGVTAGIDLALGVVAEDHGKKVAQDVAKVLLVVMKRQGGQARFSPLAGAVAKEETPITRVQQHVLAHLEEPFGIQRMAALAAMSPRHFSRVFHREVNMTPMAFLQNARIDRARELLESGDLPLKTVAYRSGFGSVRYMRQVFSERLGVTPGEYRQQFG
ncbi:GlxA family transcriptional regulator [Pseudomonas sp. zfem002]|uniref:GlxA family transcriptional regulator n=1 Tax=Pseudomonas sp. zfem002 TaxID=3078197 RepID=UPI002929527E|nr:GlxA family transcriptional regulator [Pseudomonas sp. zfem002]MDU9393821.1 GlxA family transcriptional regulator [Pseudomonas sp. zfem002]